MNDETRDIIRRRIEISGRVQGVGFRPFVFRLAREHGLAGHVGNDVRGVFIEIEGKSKRVDAFIAALPEAAPPLADIASIETSVCDTNGDTEFLIDRSSYVGERSVEISPDVATCPDCLGEVFDAADRRHGYPFTNCTNCGPRYSIISSTPYDRPNTTMRSFIMCPTCQSEYDDPADRRFHAQPNACPVCGPELRLVDTHGNDLSGVPIRTLALHLRNGRIAAIKGLGGFHLAVRADDDAAVQRLRERKGREAKPLALMVGSIEAADTIVDLCDAARKAMLHWSRPIVLAPRRSGCNIAASVAPDTEMLGVMLPYTPFHHLLFAQWHGPLVMTSGNPSEEPLCHDNDEALRRLSDIADVFLLHNRPIERPIDDSVMLAVDLGSDHSAIITPIRRSRGFVPQPIRLPESSGTPVLAVGGELKSTVCVLSGDRAVLSEHLGELSNPAAYRNFTAAIDRLCSLLDVRPEAIAYDLHPDYAAHRYARNRPERLFGVQHHHAHAVSCLAEHGLTGEAIGIVCDGTGYGTDGAIWGCEIMRFDAADFDRTAHLRYFPLPGGDTAAAETWRPALGLLHETFGADLFEVSGKLFKEVDEETLQLTTARLTSHDARLPRTSSLGRLFDAASFILGICSCNRYEAEAAIRLEHAAGKRPAKPLPLPLSETNNGLSPLIDFAPLLRALVEQLKNGRDREELAAAFHESIAAALYSAAAVIAARFGINRVVLSGGCFANRRLLSRLNELLLDGGFEVLIHKKVPCGDGGLALGQAVVAAERLKREDQ